MQKKKNEKKENVLPKKPEGFSMACSCWNNKFNNISIKKELN